MKRIIWIHGLSSTSKIFNYLRLSLPKHKAILIDYDSHRSIENVIEEIVINVPPDEPFSLVCHSLGGIYGKLIASRYEVNIENIVTISTPFGGSDTADTIKWFYPSMKIFKDIGSNSSILREAREQSDVPHTALISITGNLPIISELNDGIVTINSQKAVQADKFIEIPSNHFEILQDPTTVREVKKIIF